MKRIFPYVQITAGTVIAALAVNLFLMPNQLASGGLGGLLLILHYLWEIPMGSTYFLVNIPAIYLLYRIYGWQGLARTIWGIAAFSLFLDLTEPLSIYAPTTNPLLAAIYAGLLVGLGLGLTLIVGGSTGGTSTVAQAVRHYTGMDASRFLFLTDLLILAFGAVVLNLEAVLYGLLVTFIMARVIQAVQEGLNTSRCLMIISEHPDDVSQAIMHEVRRGVTRLDGTGEYSRQRRPVLMCVVRESEVVRIKRLVLQTDPEAFVLITDAREVNGRGFTLETDIRPIPFWSQSGH